MRILVTGYKGYVGHILAPMLVAAGHTVVGLDSDLFAACALSASPMQVPDIKKDLRDVEQADLDGFDAVIHLAAISNDPIGDLNPELTYAINHRASVRLAQLSKAAGCTRFLFSSSCSIYGAAGDAPLTEQAAFNPVTPYGLSKMLVERDVAKLADDQFSPTFLRSATAYGASPRPRFDLVVNNLVAYAYTTGQIYLKSDGTPWRPLIHIEDMSRAFLAIVQAPREVVHNQAFNVGRSTENYRIRELADIAGQIVPGCEIVYAHDAGPDKRTYRVDFSKIAELLPEFQPVWDVRHGMQEVYALYQSINLQREDFEGPRFLRIDHLRRLLDSGQLGADMRWPQSAMASAQPSAATVA